MMEETFFCQKVNKSNKSEMVDFLSGHFRYDTMNSWNQATSWANNMKIYNCIPREYQDKVFEMLETNEFYESFNDLIYDYDSEHGHLLQAGFNGRSGGYLVMYEGHVKHKTIFTFKNTNQGRDYADGYGWMDIEEAKERGLYKKIIKRVSSYPGRSIDNYDREDYEDMSMYELREIVKKVQRFDQLCDDIRSETIEMAKHCEVEEEEYIVTKTRKILS